MRCMVRLAILVVLVSAIVGIGIAVLSSPSEAAIVPGKTRLVQDCVGRDLQILQQGSSVFGGILVTTDNAPVYFSSWFKLRTVLDNDGCITSIYTHWSLPVDTSAEKIVLQHRYLTPNMLDYWTIQANMYDENRAVADQAFAAWQQQKIQPIGVR